MGSEAAAVRELLAPYCTEGIGLEMGAGGDVLAPNCITFDMVHPYTDFGQARQVLRGDCRSLPFICDEAFPWVSSSHLLEDFTYAELRPIVSEWRRVLQHGGLLITNCPDQARFKAHCAATGQGDNPSHKEADFSLETFKEQVIGEDRGTGRWEVVFEKDFVGPYSWVLVLRKV